MNKENSSEYPCGGLLEGDEIEKEKEMTNDLLDILAPKRFPSKDAEAFFKGDEGRHN